VILIMLAAGFLFEDFLLYRTSTTAYGEIKTFRLEDGSQVTLNAHSSLRVPRFGFGKMSREVYLAGEGEFIVKHTPDHQRFLVHTPGKVEVEVLGTEFIVDSRSSATRVVLSKGKVQLNLQHMADKPIAMQPGDVVKVDTQGKFSITSSQPIEEYAAWKDRRFVFDNTPVREIAQRIRDIYGTEIIIPDQALASRTITGTYKADDAQELLYVLSKILDVQLSRRGEKIILNSQSPSF
jgi:ferric-dicitrate binding protein FerR (iron transport regulator)